MEINDYLTSQNLNICVDELIDRYRRDQEKPYLKKIVQLKKYAGKAAFKITQPKRMRIKMPINQILKNEFERNPTWDFAKITEI